MKKRFCSIVKRSVLDFYLIFYLFFDVKWMFSIRVIKKTLIELVSSNKKRSFRGLLLLILIIVFDFIFLRSILGYLNYTSYSISNINIYSNILLLISSVLLFQIWFLGPGVLEYSTEYELISKDTGERERIIGDTYIYDVLSNKHVSHPFIMHLLTLTYIGRKNTKFYFLFNLYKLIYHILMSYILFGAFLYDDLLYGFDIYFIYMVMIQLYLCIGSFFYLYSFFELILFFINCSSSLCNVKYKNIVF